MKYEWIEDSLNEWTTTRFNIIAPSLKRGAHLPGRGEDLINYPGVPQKKRANISPEQLKLGNTQRAVRPGMYSPVNIWSG